MKPYGVKREDQGCCPGHDKYPTERYNNMTAKQVRRRNKHAKGSARQEAKREIAAEKS